MATHSSILAWRISWTEKPGGLLSTGSKKVRLDLETKQQQDSGSHFFWVGPGDRSLWGFNFCFLNLYLFIFGCAGSSVLQRLFLSCSEQGATI